MRDEFEAALEGVEPDRRAFLKKLAVGTAFATPVVASFSMTGIKSVYAAPAQASGSVGGNETEQSTTSTTEPTTTTTTTTTTTASNQSEN